MAAVDHPSYREELQRCNYTLEYVQKSLDATTTRKERLDKEIEQLKKHFSSDNSQDYIDLTIKTLLQSSADLKIRNLIAAMSKPYFARVDFREKGKDAAEKLYIGKMSLMRDEDQQVIIVDWRAPIANLYYEGRLGQACYNCPDGNIEGELVLKRQFSINGGRLEEIFDIDITTNDEFLQAYLGANASNRLKEIVSTIQTEQNEVIRADMWTPLIVQGAAGSGKTTIALHRIAYLIYTHEKSFKPENFMIIAPNRLFLNYISEVLPELGVERVRQSTFEDFAMDIIGKRFKVRDANEKLNLFVNHKAGNEQAHRNEFLRKASEFKASMKFKDILDEYLSIIEKSFIPKEDFTIEGKTVYKYEEINDLFLNQYFMLPIAKRIDEIKKHLKNRLKLKEQELINHLHALYDSRVSNVKMSMEDSDERQQIILQIFNEKEQKIDKIASYAKKAVDEYVKRISQISPYAYYKELISDKELFMRLAQGKTDRETAEFTREYTAGVLASGSVDIEDFAPLIHLKFRIYGLDEKIPVRHIVIDEAQDFSVFQLYVLKQIIKDSSFTILGDLCQGIHSYRGLKDWDDVGVHVFKDSKCRFLTLETSYRTTIEIMEAANSVIKKLNDSKLVKAKPVIRHGEKVSIERRGSVKEIASCIEEKIHELRHGGLKSIAIICKTLDECREMQNHLKKFSGELQVVTGKENEYRSGLVIVPSFLAKGLEFDAVIIANAGAEHYKEEELDIKLLYVAMTRPLHKLIIYYTGELSPLLK